MFSKTLMNVGYRISTRSNLTVQNITCHRSLHLVSRSLRRDFIIRTKHNCQLSAPILNATFIRNKSEFSANAENASTTSPITAESNAVHTTDTSQVENIVAQIPEPPTPSVVPQEIVETIVGEPSLQSLGLGSWWPPGMLQQWLELLHVSAGLPWWETIILTTILARTLMFPIVVRIQRYTAKMNNIQPELQYLQQQMTEARQMGDTLEVSRLSYEMHNFMKEKGIDPLKNAALPLIQAPIFISFFMALRGMVQLPVESMKTGGIWWFHDLTVPDPNCILPVLTSVTLSVTIEAGTDTVRAQSLGMMRYGLRAVPIIMFPFIMNFEGAILCYWVTTNIFSLCQVLVLRIPSVRQYFQIPELLKHDPKRLPVTKKKFVEGFKDSWTNLKVAREVNARVMYDETVFERYGRGPVPKTYKYDPTKVRNPNAMLTKKREGI